MTFFRAGRPRMVGSSREDWLWERGSVSLMPRERWPDSTLALFAEGYEFASKRCERHASDVFEARVLLQPTIFMRGRDAAELFYNDARFRRRDAAPRPMRRVLFGEGGVQGLDGDPHRHRKQMFMSLMTPDRIRDLVRRTRGGWLARMAEWERRSTVVLYDVVAEVLTEAVHAWAGVPLDPSQLGRHTGDLHAMITGAGTVGAGYLGGRRARRRAERRVRRVIDQVRSGAPEPPEDSALHVIAWHRDPDGELLDAHVAAVELLNILRPTVAVDRFIVFCALALHHHPRWREQLRTGGEDLAERFVQEVRRYYPFFPFAVARVREDFDWNRHRFPRGRRVMLDLYATNHDPAVWRDPSDFRPERFEGWSGDPFDLVPQGGGDHYDHHRCAGEWLTVELMKAAVDLLTRSMTYEVPDQDLRLARGRVPALPRSGFVIANVRAT